MFKDLKNVIYVFIFLTGMGSLPAVVHYFWPDHPELSTEEKLAQAQRQAADERAKRERAEALKEQVEKDKGELAEILRGRETTPQVVHNEVVHNEVVHNESVRKNVNLQAIVQLPETRPAPLPRPPTALPPPEATIRPSLNVVGITGQHNMDVRGQPGMAINVGLQADGMQGRHLYVAAYFFSRSGAPLGAAGRYHSRDGQVSIGASFVPQSSRATGNVVLAIPYAELHVPPDLHQELAYRVVVFDRDSDQRDGVLFNSGSRPFSLN
jgi:hypothetical protein